MSTGRFYLLVFLASLTMGLGGGMLVFGLIFGLAYDWSQWWSIQCWVGASVLAMSGGLWWIGSDA